MKLAEALSERADLQKRVEQLRQRLYLNARVQEGEEPSENPSALLDELNQDIERLSELIARINKTNCETFSDSLSLTELLAKRDCLRLKEEIMREFLREASSTVMRGMKSEIKIVSTVKVSQLQKQCDDMAKALRELDVKLQSLNWTSELL